MKRILMFLGLLPMLAFAGTPLSLKYDSQTGSTIDIPSTLHKLNFPAGFELQVDGVLIGGNALPSQTGNSGKYLSTNGTVASWVTLNVANWDTAYSDRLKWDGGATGLVAATGRISLGLGTLATQNGTFSGTSSGTNTGDQTISLTGDVTGSGTGSFAATIANSAVTLAKMANMATASLIYRKTAGSGAPEVNSLATLKTDLGLTGTNSGDQDLSGYQTKAGTLALAGFSSITGRIGNANLPLGAQLYDNASLLSVDAGNRVLKDSHGTTVMDWETDTLITINEAIHSYGIDIDIWPGPPGPGEDAAIELHSDERSLFRNALQVGVGANTIFFDPTTGYITLGAYDSSIVSSATATRTWTLPNASGTFLLTNGSAASLTSFPTLNQNTTGSAASLSIIGQTGKLTVVGLTSTDRAKTFRDAADTILELGGSYTPTGTWTNMTLVTPALGTPSAIVLTNATSIPAGQLTGSIADARLSANIPLLNAANTFSLNNTNSYASTASTPAMLYSGAWLTGGTGTTNFPHFLLQATGTTASTTWSTAGTGIGLNAVTGFTGNFADFKLAGASISAFKITSGGNLTVGGNISTGSSGTLTAGSGEVDFGASALIYAPSSGVLRMSTLAGTGFTGLDFRSDNNSGFRIGFAAVNGIDLQSGAGTTTWNDASTAGSGTVANRYLFGIAAPTLTATNSSVTDTVASTFYIGGAPTAGTNNAIGTAWALNVAAGNTNLGGTVTIGGGTAVAKILSATATLDFGSTAAGAVSDLTITVTGAALGDVVSLGIPNASVPASGTFSAWVSSTNTVTVRYENNDLLTARDPASGTFRVMVTQF